MKTIAITLLIGLMLISVGCVSQTVDDTGISTKVKAKLAADSETSAIKIGVDTVNKVVTLSGVVPTEREKAKAEQIARNTEGVTQVVNNITINPNTLGATNVGEKAREAADKVEEKAREAAGKVEEKVRSAAGTVEEKAREAGNTVAGDGTILAKIKAKFLTEGITGTNVDVANGNVTIKGEVENEAKRTLAADIARSTNGVKSVNNQLAIKKK
jgi:hyperosmotically inducible protein